MFAQRVGLALRGAGPFGNDDVTALPEENVSGLAR